MSEPPHISERIAGAHARTATRFPKTLNALREAEMSEAAIASFFADPRWPQIRAQVSELLGCDLKPLDDLLARVRRSVWKDFSEPVR